MKKLCVCLSLLFILCFAGCNGSIGSSATSSDGWQEIQSITYYVNNSLSTVTSTYEWEYTEEVATEEEVNNAPDDQKGMVDVKGSIQINKNDFITELDNMKGKTFYYIKDYHLEEGKPVYSYAKLKLNIYAVHYVKIKFYDDGSFDLQYKNETNRIKALSYKITYFND